MRPSGVSLWAAAAASPAGTVGESHDLAADNVCVTKGTAGLKTDGAFANRSDGLARSVQDITRQQDRFNERLSRVESSLRRQYTALDSMLASMNTTSTYLTQQLAALQAQRAV